MSDQVHAVQNLAEHYKNGVHMLRLYGNSNDECKHLFKDRLLTRVTPTFFFWRNGVFTHCTVTHARTISEGCNKADYPTVFGCHCHALN